MFDLIKTRQTTILIAGLLLGMLVLAACQPVQAPAEMPEADAPAATATPAQEEEPADEMAMMGMAEAGEYIFNASVGCGCHFNRDMGALAGGNQFQGGFGSVYAVNLTPDMATGIGSATDSQLADAIRFHKGVDGRNLFIMPAYATMADQDVADLIAYLRSLEPVENPIPARELTIDVPEFTMAEAPPAMAPVDGPERGQYLMALARCGRCHTPANDDGSPDMELFLAGAPFRDTVAPNLTPDELTGLGAWSEQEIADFLGTGIYADGFESHPGMKGQIDGGIGQLTEGDRLAMAAFLKSLPPVENLPQASE